MSVGHVARLLEEAGIPTVILAVRSFQSRLVPMSVPRLAISPNPMGRPVGAPGDREGQRATIMAALKLLEDAKEGGTVLTLSGQYRAYRS